jgi:hypothetical protein
VRDGRDPEMLHGGSAQSQSKGHPTRSYPAHTQRCAAFNACKALTPDAAGMGDGTRCLQSWKSVRTWHMQKTAQSKRWRVW